MEVVDVQKVTLTMPEDKDKVETFQKDPDWHLVSDRWIFENRVMIYEKVIKQIEINLN